MSRDISREADERVLAWLAMRSSGMSSVDTAKAYGVTSEKVRVATNRVRMADERTERFDSDAAYWWSPVRTHG